MIKLSIVTATYNRIEELKKNIKSVAAQSFKDKEHIVIDALSTDGTDKLISDYKKEVDYPVIYIREKDKGTYDAFNKGIKIASGEWIHILNSDDYYFNNENLGTILKGDYKNIDVLACAILVKNIDTNCNDGSLNAPSYNDKIKYYNFPHPGMIVKKDFYEANGLYNIKYKIISDAIFVLQHMPKAKYIINKMPLVAMDIRGISNKISFRRTYERLVCLFYYYKFPLGYKIKSVFLILYYDMILLLILIKGRLKKTL